MKSLQVILIFSFLSISFFAQCQNNKVMVRGKLLDCDSIPVESVYLISYKTLRAFTTDEKGEFNILLESDDSLKVHHLAYQSVIIKPKLNAVRDTIYLAFDDQQIEAVDIKYRDIEMEYFEKNMETIHRQLAKMGNYN